MNPKELKVGDKVRILDLPHKSKPYFIDPDTVKTYKRLIERRRPVRISSIDEYGNPWFNFKFKNNDEWEYHSMAIFEEDENWIKLNNGEQ